MRGLISKAGTYCRGMLTCRHLERRKGFFLPHPGSKLILGKGSKIELDGILGLGVNALIRNGRSSILRMDADSRLVIKGAFSFYYGADIILFGGAELILGDGFINSDCKIRCHKKITIGDGCAISHDVTIMDSNAHMLDGHKGTAPVKIGDHVWIGTRATILSGVLIGEGAVIAAGAVVTKDIPPFCLAAGIPAKVIRENIVWEV